MILWPNGSLSIPRVTSEFNRQRRHPVTGKVRPHNGIDLAGWSTIVSPVAGVVTVNAYQPSGAGYWVEVTEHGTGDRFRFFHLAKSGTPHGTRVVAGDVLGVMGRTGSATGIHLHFEVHPAGESATNPRTYYDNRQEKEITMTAKDVIDALIAFRVDNRNIWDSLKQAVATAFSIEKKVDQLLARQATQIDVDALAKAIVLELGKK